MEIRELMEKYEVPSIAMTDIPTNTLPHQRLMALLISNGVQKTDDLRNMSDADIMSIPLFGKQKMIKLRKFLTEWYKEGFPIRNRLNVNEPSTVMTSLLEEVFGKYKNLDIVAMRENFHTYESIGEKYGRTRQNIQYVERWTFNKFLSWYKKYNLSEKIGDFDNFRLYCDLNFPEDQRELKAAVHRFVKFANK